MKGKQPTDMWDGRALQQEEGMTRFWSLVELSSPGERTGRNFSAAAPTEPAASDVYTYMG